MVFVPRPLIKDNLWILANYKVKHGRISILMYTTKHIMCDTRRAHLSLYGMMLSRRLPLRRHEPVWLLLESTRLSKWWWADLGQLPNLFWPLLQSVPGTFRIAKFSTIRLGISFLLLRITINFVAPSFYDNNVCTRSQTSNNLEAYHLFNCSPLWTAYTMYLVKLGQLRNSQGALTTMSCDGLHMLGKAVPTTSEGCIPACIWDAME